MPTPANSNSSAIPFIASMQGFSSILLRSAVLRAALRRKKENYFLSLLS
jgi:hypothetical protein